MDQLFSSINMASAESIDGCIRQIEATNKIYTNLLIVLRRVKAQMGYITAQQDPAKNEKPIEQKSTSERPNNVKKDIQEMVANNQLLNDMPNAKETVKQMENTLDNMDEENKRIRAHIEMKREIAKIEERRLKEAQEKEKNENQEKKMLDEQKKEQPEKLIPEITPIMKYSYTEQMDIKKRIFTTAKKNINELYMAENNIEKITPEIETQLKTKYFEESTRLLGLWETKIKQSK